MAHSSWGPGWPNCQPSKINSGFVVSGTRFPGGVRHELVDLVSMLVQECKNRGYRFGTSSDPSYGCWGYSCRAISGSNNPSNHSWGLAVDINAPSNPYTSPLVTDMPSWMPDLWNAYGFRWGGDYSGSKDAMHYEFMGSVTDAAHHTAQARANGLGGTGGGKPPPDWFDTVDEATLRRIVGEEIEQHIASLWNTPMVEGRPPSGLTLQLVADNSAGDTEALKNVGRTVWDTPMVEGRPPSGATMQLVADRHEEMFHDINEIQEAVVPNK